MNLFPVGALKVRLSAISVIHSKLTHHSSPRTPAEMRVEVLEWRDEDCEEW